MEKEKVEEEVAAAEEEAAAENIRLTYNKIGQRELSSACLSLEREGRGQRGGGRLWAMRVSGT